MWFLFPDQCVNTQSCIRIPLDYSSSFLWLFLTFPLLQFLSFLHSTDFQKLPVTESCKSVSCPSCFNQNAVVKIKGFWSRRPGFKHKSADCYLPGGDLWVGWFKANNPETVNLRKSNGDYNLLDYAMVRIVIFSLPYFIIILYQFCRGKERRDNQKVRDRKWAWGRDWKQRI